MVYRAKILQPIRVGKCEYKWNELEIKQSLETNAGFGVFATQPLKAGIMIPLLGVTSKDPPENTSHLYRYQRYRSNEFIDGDPRINPYGGVGCHGLAVALMCNESTKKKMTCIFKLNHLVTAVNLKEGQELTVDYGNDYNRIGYTLTKNKYRDAEYKALLNVKWPSLGERINNLDYWNAVISMYCKSGAFIEPPMQKEQYNRLYLM